MFSCLYCGKQKEDSESSLEHVIPQFLGGDYCPASFKISNVCKSCNNNLGLFVDASFEKTWFISSNLSLAAMKLFDIKLTKRLPLICMGICKDIAVPGINEDEVCELWLGPSGEQVYLIRPLDETKSWYVGGDPIKLKKLESRAYFICSETSHKKLEQMWLCFKNAFRKSKTKKIMCTKISGADPKDIGFVEPDELDQMRCKLFMNYSLAGGHKTGHINIKVDYDQRFMAKLALGIAYVVYGDKIEKSPYTKELRSLLWDKSGDSNALVRGKHSFGENDRVFNNLSGEENAVVLMIQKTNSGLAINFNLMQQLNWSILSATNDLISSDEQFAVDDGIVLVLFGSLGKCIVLSFLEFICHRNGSKINTDITLINKC